MLWSATNLPKIWFSVIYLLQYWVTQPAFTCPKSTVETPIQYTYHNIMKRTCRHLLVQSQQWKHQNNIPTTVLRSDSAGTYLLKANRGNTRTMCEIDSKLTITTAKRRHWCRFSVFIVNFEQISQIVLLFPLLNLNK